MTSHKIIELAERHRLTDFADSGSVSEANEIAEQLSSVIELMVDEGQIPELLELLNHDSAGEWVAFSIAERQCLSRKQKKVVLSKIKNISKAKGVNAIGAEHWLKDHGY